MSPTFVALAIVAAGGGVLALSAHDARPALIGLLVALVAAPLLSPGGADRVASPVRIAAAVVAVLLLRWSLRDGRAFLGSRIGWPAQALAAAAALLGGAAAQEATMPGLGPTAATAAGCALLILAAAPMLERTDLPRFGIGVLLALTGADLLRGGLAGPPSTFESVLVAASVVAVAGAVAIAIARTSSSLGTTSHAAARPR